MTSKCDYSWEVKDGVLCIEDKGGLRTVTNAIEEVLEEMRLGGADLSLPIIHRDSTGVWDAVILEEGKLLGWRPLNETSREVAIARIKRTWTD